MKLIYVIIISITVMNYGFSGRPYIKAETGITQIIDGKVNRIDFHKNWGASHEIHDESNLSIGFSGGITYENGFNAEIGFYTQDYNWKYVDSDLDIYEYNLELNMLKFNFVKSLTPDHSISPYINGGLGLLFAELNDDGWGPLKAEIKDSVYSFNFGFGFIKRLSNTSSFLISYNRYIIPEIEDANFEELEEYELQFDLQQVTISFTSLL